MRSLLAVSLLPMLALACGSSNERPSIHDSAGSPGGGSGSDPIFAENVAPEAAPNDGAFHPPTELGCASRAQEILIVDFRSGWWSGGGGGAFYGVALPTVVDACPLTSVDYHHFETTMHVKCVYESGSGGGCQMLPAVVTVDDIRSRFEKPSVSDYTQIWLLSGSDQDPSDIHTGDALFQGVLGDTKGTCIPMLVAAGDGFVTHANSLATDFGMGPVFSQKTDPPSFFSVSIMPAAAATKLDQSKLQQHLLFNGVSSIVDRVSAFIQQARGDTLAASVPGPHIYDVLANDSDGNPTIAVGAANVSGDGYRPFIFDSGWQRMYLLGQDPGTTQYLKNIVMYLGLVGCKAAPIGPPK